MPARLAATENIANRETYPEVVLYSVDLDCEVSTALGCAVDVTTEHCARGLGVDYDLLRVGCIERFLHLLIFAPFSTSWPFSFPAQRLSVLDRLQSE